MKNVFAAIITALIEIMKNNLKHAIICQDILLYIQKNINIMGADIKPYLIQISMIYLPNIEFERLEPFLNVRILILI